MNNIIDLSALEISNKIRAGELSALEVTKAFIARINNLEKKLDAFNCVMEKEALSRAGEIDARIKAGDASGELLGVPVAVKDNLMIKGVKTTCSSKILENYTAPYNATVIEKLEKEGAVFVGKTNLDEFAMGSSTENSAFKTTKNPWDIQRVPGGSSGGSACAVAAKMAPLALGSDTGGSIRQPASLCGVVGLKPTYGSVSRFGLVAFASSLDQIGPFARTVEDSALLFKLISGHDSKDSTSAKIEPREFIGDMKKDIKGLRVGLPKEYFIDGVDKEVNDSVRAALKVLEGLGAVIEEISLPHTQYATAVYYIIAPSEASANLARYDGVKYGFRAQSGNLLEQYEKSRGQGFGPEVKRRIMLGTYALSAGYYDAYYGKAQKVRTLIKQDFENAFRKVDVIVTPTSPSAAFKAGEKSSNPLEMYLSDIFTISCNLAGIPGISIPCGFTANKLPIGLQILGKPFGEAEILRTAYNYERNCQWHAASPNL
ncbi:MAG: aspartyl/glutamyl-tRNA amidotransferase subunit A [Elusimicrobia bacterium RIFOXYB12_FULL_50_12]|nr:MAG: aspartyl/glutamyl-tRNA amidotransferase subunit A [Elusimicrobia bacterium RIFOXYA12_FULL_49_49]OGS09541.1 MAG: aspartyl/glutamyl-tRNA amidotransferase subunit A [Elusimicrobia bacterium RIFOXYB1_FULL_48_9]OGS16473.1 MAG: aspartyl/glutamyl-tRNA amidotransferase subunit A [Elusimicrobia bacterium RIFOXYA2_FULL_47_53]OGS26022.1 MAG: aspartyl/glutamyl-tRNA amidotransferase subunit A [Elusimicrobia bacterium RIFOXYB12_FULL_50_12]OGS29638.1 MAG: aspartyl/glutamyl-tRNA amidotransferase subuni